MNNFLKLCLAFFIIVLAGGVVIIVLNIVSNNSKKNTEIANNKIYLNQCLSSAENAYNSAFNSNCTQETLSGPCILPIQSVNALNNIRTQAKADCFQHYPIK